MRQIHFLLGDTLRGHACTVDEWLSKTQPQADPLTNPAFAETRFEYACALLYDSRPHRAIETFQLVALVRSESEMESEVLARLGCGKALNSLRRYRPAEAYFSAAIERSKACPSRQVQDLAFYFHVMNSSDSGGSIAEEDRIFAPREDLEVSLTDFLIEVFRIYVCSRLCLRSGDRQKGRDILEAIQRHQQYSQVSPILKGSIQRMKGILLDVLGSTNLARSDLKQAIEVFSSVGFRLGEVQAALSLARTHGSSDKKQTREYLTRAQQILEATEAPDASTTEGRHMPGEHADLFSRLGTFEAAQGKFEEAITYFRKDLKILSDLTVHSTEELSRAAAHAHRNIGRALRAQRDFEEAAGHFHESYTRFRAARDPINSFATLVSLCDIWLETKSFPAVREGLHELGAIIHGLEDRPKERALIDVLKARLCQAQDEDTVQALAIIRRACGELRRFGPDYYYIKALLFHAQVLVSLGDGLEARHCLNEAKRCAANLEVPDLERIAENGLMELGVPEPEIHRQGKSDIEKQVELVGSVERGLTVMFADIREFTALSGKVDLGELTDFIYEFAGIISKCVSIEGGLPVRFLGDSVMALFGVRDTENSAATDCLRAVNSTYEMFGNLRTRRNRTSNRFENIGIGFGIARGSVIAGRFGSAELSELGAALLQPS